jgi:hypothetical protein
MRPRQGDIFVSTRSAIVAHELSVVPRPPHPAKPTRIQAIAAGSQLANQLGVDLRITEDLRNFLPLERYRAVPRAAGNASIPASRHSHDSR